MSAAVGALAARSISARTRSARSPVPAERSCFGAEESAAGLIGLSDAELIGRAADGDRLALGVLYDRHARVVFAFAHRILRDREAAEDLLQEVFFRAWQRAAVYQTQRGELVTWLLSITHNLAIDELRRRRRRPLKADGEDPEVVLLGVADAARSVEEDVELGALRGAIAAALASLPPAQRKAIELTYFGGLTQREVAATLDVPLGTIKTRLRLGLDKLRVQLERATAGTG